MDKNDDTDRIIIVESVKAAVEYLKETKGNVLATTGVLEIYEYTKLEDFEKRIYARVFPNKDIIKVCTDIGISGQHLIGMKGPCSKLMNHAMLKDFQIRYLVTKDSGIASGFLEKMEAAFELGVKVIVVAAAYHEEEEAANMKKLKDKADS